MFQHVKHFVKSELHIFYCWFDRCSQGEVIYIFPNLVLFQCASDIPGHTEIKASPVKSLPAVFYFFFDKNSTDVVQKLFCESHRYK